MQCSRCEHETPAGQTFYGECGTTPGHCQGAGHVALLKTIAGR